MSDDLLKPKYRNSKIPMFGSCYVVSEAFYHLMGKQLGLVPYRGRDTNGDMHYWLQTGDTKYLPEMVVDLTAVQYTAQRIWFDYTKGKRCAFQTKQPSKRTQILIKRVKQKLKVTHV